MPAPARVTLSYAQILKIALDAGFRRDGSGSVLGDSAHTITAIALAESGGDSQAVGPQTVSADARGLMQINMKAHGTAVGGPVTLDCAYTPACAMAFSYGLSQGGRKFTDWVVFTTGAYKSKLQPQTQPSETNAGGDPKTGGGGVGTVEPVTDSGGGLFGVSPDEWKQFGIAVAVGLAATGLVALGAVGIVGGSQAGQTVIKLAGKAAVV